MLVPQFTVVVPLLMYNVCVQLSSEGVVDTDNVVELPEQIVVLPEMFTFCATRLKIPHKRILVIRNNFFKTLIIRPLINIFLSQKIKLNFTIRLQR